MALSFREKEEVCHRLFESVTPVYHVCSSENFEILFTEDSEFEAGISILGVCSKLFLRVIIYTFQLMSNHFHLIVGGDEMEIKGFLREFKRRLQKYLETRGRYISLGKMETKLFPIDNLEYFRVAVAYVNRNGFVANGSFSPFSYPWGASNCFFNKTMRNYYERCRKNMTNHNIRLLIHSKKADHIKDLYSLDGYVSPLSFCKIEVAEDLFRDERSYFYQISKNVESYGRIAKDIGEMICYTDEDVFQIARQKATEIAGTANLSHLDRDGKMKLARILHFDYNSSNRQIHRILKIDIPVLESMF